MRKFRAALLVTTMLVAAATPAHAEPFSSAAAFVLSFVSASAAATAASWTWAATASAVAVNAVIAAGLSGAAALIRGLTGTQRDDSGLKLQAGGVQPRTFMAGTGPTGGKLVYANTWGHENSTPNNLLVTVVSLEDLPCSALNSIWVNGAAATYGEGTEDENLGYAIPEFNKGGKDYLWIKFYDGTQTTADPYVVEVFGDDPNYPYSSDRVGYGIAYAVVTARINSELFSGPPGIVYVLDGCKFYDPRKDTSVGGSGSHRFDTPSTWEFTVNPKVIEYNVLRGMTYDGKWVYGLQSLTVGRLPLDSWFAAMNECDTDVDNNAGGTEPQFRCGGEISFATQPVDTIKELNAACNGELAEVGGTYETHCGAAGSSVLSFSDDDIIVTEQQTFDQFPGLDSLINGVTAKYPEPEQGWAMTDAPALYSSTLEAADGDRRLISDVTYGLSPHLEQVQRLMKSALQEERRFRKHTIVLPPECWAVTPLTFVSWTSARNGYEEKLFKVTATVDGDNLDQVVTLKEVDPSDYDWDPETDFKPKSIGPLTIAYPAAQPMDGWAVSGVIVSGDDGRQTAAIRMGWTVTDIDDVRGVLYEIRRASDSVLVKAGETLHFGSGQIDVSENIKPNTDYEARGQFIPASDYRTADWSSWLAVTTPDIGNERIDFGPTARQLLDFMGASFADVLDQLHAVSQTAAEAGLGAAANRQEIRRTLTAVGNLTATFDERITVASNEAAAASSDVITLTASLADKADASAVTALETLVDTQGGDITVLSGQYTDLSATIGGSYSPSSTVAAALSSLASDQGSTADLLADLNAAYGAFNATAKARIGVAANKAGATATIGYSISATDGGSAVDDGAFFLSTDGTTSSFWVDADQFIVSNGSDAAALSEAMEFVGGTLYVKNVIADSITTNELVFGAAGGVVSELNGAANASTNLVWYDISSTTVPDVPNGGSVVVMVSLRAVAQESGSNKTFPWQLIFQGSGSVTVMSSGTVGAATTSNLGNDTYTFIGAFTASHGSGVWDYSVKLQLKADNGNFSVNCTNVNLVAFKVWG